LKNLAKSVKPTSLTSGIREMQNGEMEQTISDVFQTLQ